MAISSREKREKKNYGINVYFKAAWNAIVCSSVSLAIYSLLHISDPTMEEIGSASEAFHQQNRVTSSPIRFILFLGIEGTGHHFWQDLVKVSPIYSRVKQYGLHPEFTTRLTQNLYRHKKSHWKGLWSSPCKWQDTDPMPNTTAIHEDLVATLQMMKDQVISKRKEHLFEDEIPVTVPVNFLAAGDEFGVMSYPTFLKPCRALQYPNLDIWYQACDIAQVRCDHIYIYRDPYFVIRSTVDNRNINKDRLEAIHLYSTHLQIIHSQLLLFPSRLVGCWSYEDALSQQQWSDEINPILQFPDEIALGNAIKSIFHRKPLLTDLDRQQIVPPEFSLYMESLGRIHTAVVQTCKSLKSGTTSSRLY